MSFEERSLAPGFYTLVKSGVEEGYQIFYRKPSVNKDGKQRSKGRHLTVSPCFPA